MYVSLFSGSNTNYYRGRLEVLLIYYVVQYMHPYCFNVVDYGFHTFAHLFIRLITDSLYRLLKPLLFITLRRYLHRKYKSLHVAL